ncbi:Dipeptidase A [Weissella viridescens]|uniref:Dipeptidase n=1 Tax=Weissella viridescens TaxID=1629 RepID=A0A380NZ81_WEIVI|nr:Dipeptidase A [Weissella viridescens]
MNRNHNVHILQIRNGVPDAIAGVHWLAFGANTFNTVVPFYANVSDTPAAFRDATATFDLTNMYWLSCTTALLGDTNYDLYVDLRNTHELEEMSAYRRIQRQADAQVQSDQATATGDILTQANQALADEALQRQTKLLGEMVTLGSANMTLRYNLND